MLLTKPSPKMRGFTLIELLIVVAIIAILAAIAVPNFLEAQTRAKVSRVRSDMRTVATALESYAVDNNRYPRPAERHVTGLVWGSDAFPFHARIPSHLTTPISYISSLPLDVFGNQTATLPASQVDLETRFRYFNYDYFDANPTYAALSPTSAYGRAKAQAGRWLFYSVGPDRDQLNAPTNNVYLDYDPTNGTVSLGNIIRTQRTNEAFNRPPA